MLLESDILIEITVSIISTAGIPTVTPIVTARAVLARLKRSPVTRCDPCWASRVVLLPGLPQRERC
jgi:hypothetical protein